MFTEEESKTLSMIEDGMTRFHASWRRTTLRQIAVMGPLTVALICISIYSALDNIGHGRYISAAVEWLIVVWLFSIGLKGMRLLHDLREWRDWRMPPHKERK